MGREGHEIEKEPISDQELGVFPVVKPGKGEHLFEGVIHLVPRLSSSLEDAREELHEGIRDESILGGEVVDQSPL